MDTESFERMPLSSALEFSLKCSRGDLRSRGTTVHWKITIQWMTQLILTRLIRWKVIYAADSTIQPLNDRGLEEKKSVHMWREIAWFHVLGCVPFGESKNGFFMRDSADFTVKGNAKSDDRFVTLETSQVRSRWLRQNN